MAYPLHWVGEKAPWKSFSAPIDMLEGIQGPVLDIASGPEPISLRFFRRNEITSLDINPEYCRSCARSGIETVLGDMRALPFGSAIFRSALLRHALTHTLDSDDSLVLSEVKRVLMPGGHIYIEALGDKDMRSLKGEEAGHGVRIRKDGRVWRFYTMEGLLMLVESSGFSVVKNKEIERFLPKLRATRHTLAVVAVLPEP